MEKLTRSKRYEWRPGKVNTLTIENVGLNYYHNHRDHVNGLFNLATTETEVSVEDEAQPELWKPEHWRWFLNKFD